LATRLGGLRGRTPDAPPASCSPTDRRWGGTGPPSPAEASLRFLRLQVPEAGRPPFRRQLVAGLEEQGSIVCGESLPVPFELLKGDTLPRPRIRVPVVLLDRLFVPKQGHPGVAPFEGELGVLQSALSLLSVGFDRLDEGLEISVGRRRRGGRLRFLFNFFEGLQQGMEVPRGLRLRFLLRLARRLFPDLTARSRFRLDGRRHAY